MTGEFKSLADWRRLQEHSERAFNKLSGIPAEFLGVDTAKVGSDSMSITKDRYEALYKSIADATMQSLEYVKDALAKALTQRSNKNAIRKFWYDLYRKPYSKRKLLRKGRWSNPQIAHTK